MDTFVQPQIPVPAWGDEFPGYYQLKLEGKATNFQKAAKAGDTISFYTSSGATVTVTTLITGTSVEVTTSTETDYDVQTFTMPAEGVEVKVEEA